MLSHSSGFPNWRNKEDEKLVPAFQPGSKFQYSGEGYFYLQRVLESVTGQGFAKYEAATRGLGLPAVPNYMLPNAAAA